MDGKANYFKIGVFMIGATSLLILGIIVMSAGSLFKREVTFETYIDESVQGIEVGSPVKFRGVKIGRVTEVGLVRENYMNTADTNTTPSTMVMIRFCVIAKELGDRPNYEIRRYIKEEVDRGFRLQLTSAGITGGAYVEANYFSKDKYPPMEITWQPENIYVPSVPSVYTSLIDSVDGILATVQEIPVAMLTQDTHDFLSALTTEVRDANVGEMQKSAISLLDELKATNVRINELLAKKEVDQMIEDAAATVSNAKNITKTADKKLNLILDEFQASAKEIRLASAKVNKLMESEKVISSLEKLEDSSTSLQIAAKDLPEVMKEMKAALNKFNNIMSNQGQSLELIFNNAGEVSSDLKELIRDLKNHPSKILFQNKPEPVEK